jgi:23S rRNA pseudouridine1911/1915/1917 synthase
MVEVLYEDNHLIVVNKQSGDIVQGDKTGDKPLPEYIKDYLREKYNKPGNIFCGVIHRLDRPVTGIVIFAKTSKALARMNQLFRDKDIQKTYWALVENKPKEDSGRLENYLIKNQKNNKSRVCSKNTDGSLKSSLNYKIIKSLDHYTLLEVKPITGRHHQIRVQLSHIGSIIKGDLKYGAKRSNKDASISLHAREIDFIHPVKKVPVRVVAPLPKDGIWQACE